MAPKRVPLALPIGLIKSLPAVSYSVSYDRCHLTALPRGAKKRTGRHSGDQLLSCARLFRSRCRRQAHFGRRHAAGLASAAGALLVLAASALRVQRFFEDRDERADEIAGEIAVGALLLADRNVGENVQLV